MMKGPFFIALIFVSFGAAGSIPSNLICVNEPTIENQVTSHYGHCLLDKLNSIEIYMGFFQLKKCHSTGGIDNLKYMN